ncbi:hypothetical protein JCM11491_000644, partial [Sporobolomyces phaffii]
KRSSFLPKQTQEPTPRYEALLKRDLEWRGETFKNLPQLKKRLVDDWNDAKRQQQQQREGKKADIKGERTRAIETSGSNDDAPRTSSSTSSSKKRESSPTAATGAETSRRKV